MNGRIEMSDFDEEIGEDWDDLEEHDRWEAPTIYTKYLWIPIMKLFQYTVKQLRKRRANQLVIFGNTDSGKSTATDNIVRSYLHKHRLPPQKIPLVDTPTNPTSKQIIKRILAKLNTPYGKHDSIGDLELILDKVLEKVKPLAIVLDEAGNIDDANEDEKKRILQLFRNIPQQSTVPLILIGTRKILNVMNNESQTENRFDYAESN